MGPAVVDVLGRLDYISALVLGHHAGASGIAFDFASSITQASSLHDDTRSSESIH